MEYTKILLLLLIMHALYNVIFSPKTFTLSLMNKAEGFYEVVVQNLIVLMLSKFLSNLDELKHFKVSVLIFFH